MLVLIKPLSRFQSRYLKRLLKAIETTSCDNYSELTLSSSEILFEVWDIQASGNGRGGPFHEHREVFLGLGIVSVEELQNASSQHQVSLDRHV